MFVAWFIARNNQRAGPYTSERLRQLAQEHAIQPDDMILKQGTQKWIPARAVHGLFREPGNAAGARQGNFATSSHHAEHPVRQNGSTRIPPLPRRPTAAPGPSRRLLAWTCSGVAVGVAVLLAFLCGSWSGGSSPSAPPEILAARRAEPKAPPEQDAAALEQQREKLLQEKLEIERQRTEFERRKREAFEADLRERADLERRKREEMEASLRIREAAENAEKYLPAEFETVQSWIAANADNIGRLLLGGTHPTGAYDSTSSPLVALSADRRVITLSVTVHWRGGILNHPYLTTYATTLNKTDGIGHLKVLRDTALIQIDPQFLRATEYALKEMFKQHR